MESVMQQAILITAYKNVEQIFDIIDYMGNGFEYYIHIDKKSTMELSLIKDLINVHIFKEFTIQWGSVNHLKSILLLSKEALANKKNDFFHLITGQDFPVKSVNFFNNELDTRMNYLSYFIIPADCWRNENGGMNRIEYYRPYEIFNYKTIIGSMILKIVFGIQKLLKIKRKIHYDIFLKLYGGGTYWSLTRDCLQYVLDFTNANEKAMKSMEYTFCPEEIYFQTILLNSKYVNKIVNDDIRYIDWDSGRGGIPAFLDETDYEKIKSSNKIFARKFHEDSSKALKRLLIRGNNGYSSFQ